LLGEDGKPTRIGDYELLKKIDRGAMGVVYKARHVSLDRTVALKIVADSELDEDKVAASLEHLNIVPIYEVGEHEECHYFTMKWMEGGNLAEQIQHFREHPRKAARLLAAVARAVHYGHQRGFLHRDLKPANLLLDAAGTPYVADFGVAKALDEETGVAQASLGGGMLGSSVVGTLVYMAPEQAMPHGKPLSVAADIYSLGVILYELLTGQLPLKADSHEQMLELLLEVPPKAPRELDPRIPRALEAICLKCLEKEPTRRYGSAEKLADDLERYLEGEPVEALPYGLLPRAWMWCRRHPREAGLLAMPLWALMVAAAAAVSIARAQEADLRRDASQVNVYAARMVARTVLSELTQYSHAVELAAERRELVDALEARDEAALRSFCADRFTYREEARGSLTPSEAGSPFVRCFIQDTGGGVLALFPLAERSFIGIDYGWRDYFAGARHLASKGERAAYVSMAFKSWADGKYTFAVAAPVYAADGKRWIGVLVILVASDSTLGSLTLNEPDDENRTAMLVGLTDHRTSQQSSLPARYEYTVFVRKGLGHGMHASLEPRTAQQLQQVLPAASPDGRELTDYRDPLSTEPGPWLAAFAPVGQSRFAIIVQTREKAVLAVNEQLARRIAWWSLPFALGLALVWGVSGSLRNRSAASKAAAS
jgi:serine/threonine-protein kinase